MKTFLTGLMLALSLIGCSSPKDETAAADERRKQLTEAVKQPLDQARGAEKLVFDNAEQQKKQADQAAQ